MTANNHCPLRERISSTSWFLNEFSLHSAPRYRAELIQRSLFRPRLWRQISLPDRLFPSVCPAQPVRMDRLPFAAPDSRFPHPSRRRQLSSSSKPRRDLLERFFGLPPADLGLLAEAAMTACILPHRAQIFPRAAANRADGQLLIRSRRVPQEQQALRTLRRVEWAIGAVVRHAHSPLFVFRSRSPHTSCCGAGIFTANCFMASLEGKSN